MTRIYPLSKPAGHKPPMQRWSLSFPANPDTPAVHTLYLGLQRHDSTPETLTIYTSAITAIQNRLSTLLPPQTPSEVFTYLEGDDHPNSQTWVIYFRNKPAYTAALSHLNLQALYASLNSPPSLGLWTETFTTPLSRLETNYSGLDYLPGLARLPDASTVEHTLTAYWGAARDRIPDSAVDLFSKSEHPPSPHPIPVPKGLGQYLSGENKADNIVHIRSGQFWANCSEAETEAYEHTLEPALRSGLRYLWANREDSGAMGLRFLQNRRIRLDTLDPENQTTSNPDNDDDDDDDDDDDYDDEPLKETCAAGFFRSLSDLEKWAKRHPSHLAIFNGAIKHAKTFGTERKFRTWHEVSVLKRGEARFEYLNCAAGTGVMGFVDLDIKQI
ncbi:hem-containing dehydratase protein [Aspergillus egyptiacus]|nr:hem-containing dehydratase protein [Aspergillus egyptiacus]